MLSFIKDILVMSKKRKKAILFSYFLAFFESGFANMPLFLSALLIGNILTTNVSENFTITLLALMVISIVIRSILKYYISKLDQGSTCLMFSDERIFTGNVIKKQNMGFFSKHNIGKLVSVLTNDMAFIENNGVFALAKLTCAIISIAFSSVILFVINYKIGLVYIIITMCSIILLTVFHKKSVKDAEVLKQAFQELIDAVVEYVQGISVIKAFHLKEERFNKVSNTFEKIKDVYTFYEQKSIPFLLANMCLCSIGSAIVIYLSVNMGSNNPLVLPFSVLMVLYSFNAFSPLMNIATTISMINVSKAGLDRYNSIRNLKTDNNIKSSCILENKDICFKNVSFAYEKENVIEDISVTFKQNEMTALVGESGSGKSTIINLIARFWETNNGEITLGNINVNNIPSSDFYDNFSMVFQNVYLFNDTIQNNITIGNENASKEDIVNACKKARCYDFIMALPNGFDTIIEEGGNSLSGGEKQRISIARAILKDAPIILLDEATASIDLDNEAFIQQAINELIKNKTLIVIAHKLSSIKHADKIIVLKNKKIHEVGTHEELISLNGEYKKLWDIRIK